MKILRTILFVIPMWLLMVSQSGCLLAVAAAGTGAGVAYVKGKTVSTVDADPRAVANATEQAMKDLDIKVISNDSSAVDANIVGRTARDTKIEVTVKSESKELSKIFIRAGVFGDDALQDRLL